MRPILIFWAVLVCAIGAGASAQTRDANFYQSERAFNLLSIEQKVWLQLFLTAAGYWPAVPNATYSMRLHREVLRYQADNGLVPRGIHDADDVKALVAGGGDVLSGWKLRKVYHPTAPFWVVLPSGLDLDSERLNGGARIQSKDRKLKIELLTFGAGDVPLRDWYEHFLGGMLNSGDRINFKVQKSDFFVIHGHQGRYNRYVRFHQIGSAISGFDMAWSNDGAPHYGDRLVNIVSGSLWASLNGMPYPSIERIYFPWDREQEAPRPAAPQVSRAAPAPSSTPVPSTKEPGGPSSGTGFFITKAGHIVTNQHVVDGCVRVSARITGQSPRHAQLLAADKANDLALLKIDGETPAVAKVRLGARLGEQIAAFGYPLTDLLAAGGNFTLGNITALAGLGDDARHIQISAPVQAGNSGGPLLDEYGNVVGVVTAKLNALRTMVLAGDLPQNVNFAIKATTLVNFLDVNSISYEVGSAAEALKPADLADRGRAMSAFIECQK